MTGTQQDSSRNDDMAATTVSAEDSPPHATTALGPPPEMIKHWMKGHRTFVSSSIATVISQFTAYPLDTMKTRMQSFPGTTFMSCVRDTYKEEGVRGFYRGSLVPLFTVTMVRTISMEVYQKAKYKYSDAIGQMTGNDEPLVVVNRPGSTPTFATIACFAAAGATAGGSVAVLSCPFELTKQAAQNGALMARTMPSSMDDPLTRKSYKDKGTLKVMQTIIANRGIRGMWTGYSLHLFRDFFGTGIYFATYESIKQVLVKFSKSDSPTSPLAVTTAGATCGVVSYMFLYPVDTWKAQYQKACLMKAKGQYAPMPKLNFFAPSGFNGIGVTMTRTALVNAVFMSVFEYIKKQVNALPDIPADPIE